VLDIPILQVRDLLKGYVNSTYIISPSYVAHRLQINEDQARRLLLEMEHQSWISKDAHFPDCWTLTSEGARLAAASARRPIKRKTADRLLEQFLNRVNEVNDTSYFLYRVIKVALFGSYLSEAQEMGDVDVLIYLEPKEADTDVHKNLCQERNYELMEKGKRISEETVGFFWEEWPKKETYQYLRKRSQSLSLHSPIDESILSKSENRIIFQA